MMMLDIHDIVIIHDTLPVFLFSPYLAGVGGGVGKGGG